MVNTHYPPPPTESRGRPGRFHMPLSPGDLHGNGPPLHDCPNPFNTASPPGHYHPPFPESRGPRDDFRCRFRPTICMAMHPLGFSKILEDYRGFSRILEESIEKTIQNPYVLLHTPKARPPTTGWAPSWRVRQAPGAAESPPSWRVRQAPGAQN